MNPKDENEVIGSGKSNKVSNGPWECRVSKKDEEAQRKQTGQVCLREKKKKKKGTQEPISRKTNGHDKALGERVNNRPKEAQQD